MKGSKYNIVYPKISNQIESKLSPVQFLLPTDQTLFFNDF